MIDFSKLKSLAIPEGTVSRILAGSRVLWNKNKKLLPDGYTLLDYIESNGEQYINADFVPNQDTRVVCKAVCEVSGAINQLFGARASNNPTNAFNFFASSAGYYRSDYGGRTSSFPETVNTTEPIVIDKNRETTTINGVHEAKARAATFSAGCSMVLFGTNTNGTVTCGRVRIYYFKIYDNGVLVRDLTPCMNPAGEIGMYDRVTKTFYGNSGTGEFTYGHAFVEYIEGTGTQYIDTGFIADSNTKVVMDCQSMGNGTMSSAQAFFGARTGTTSECFAVYWHKGDGSYRYYYGTDYGSKKLDRITDRITITADKNVATFGDAVTLTRPVENFSGSYPIYLFAMNNAGEVMGATKLRVYSCRMYDGSGVLVRHYVPCRTMSGEYGMYDKVDGQFYGNAGTGAFAGSEGG